jgi:hypothetical protein
MGPTGPPTPARFCFRWGTGSVAACRAGKGAGDNRYFERPFLPFTCRQPRFEDFGRGVFLALCPCFLRGRRTPSPILPRTIAVVRRTTERLTRTACVLGECWAARRPLRLRVCGVVMLA